jgi:sugar/nucleoside kinase (ribokinase family)
MQLNHSTGGDGGEGIETFEGERSIGGGSVSMACKTLARLCHGAPLDDGYMQVTPPVVSSISPLCMIGNDDSGNKLLSLLENCGSACRNVDTRVLRSARATNAGLRTALSVLPIYRDGRRGCFFDAASNNSFSAEQMMELFGDLSAGTAAPMYGAILFGYPHLLPMMQGEALARMFSQARKIMMDGGLVVLDLNGVPETPFVRAGALRNLNDLKNDKVIGAALEHVDLLHMNEDELALLTGCRNEFAIAKAVELFLQCGVAVVAVTRGKKGSYVACNNGERFQKTPML